MTDTCAGQEKDQFCEFTSGRRVLLRVLHRPPEQQHFWSWMCVIAHIETVMLNKARGICRHLVPAVPLLPRTWRCAVPCGNIPKEVWNLWSRVGQPLSNGELTQDLKSAYVSLSWFQITCRYQRIVVYYLRNYWSCFREPLTGRSICALVQYLHWFYSRILQILD